MRKARVTEEREKVGHPQRMARGIR